MKKEKMYKSFAWILIPLFVILFIYMYQSLERTSLERDELEVQYKILENKYVQIETSLDSAQNQFEKNELLYNSEINIYESEFEFYKELNLNKDKLIASLYSNREAESMTDNTIDDFMKSHSLVNYGTSTLLKNDYIYMNLWKKELTHAYEVFKGMVHPFFYEYLNKSLSSIVDFANSEGEVSVAFFNVEMYNRDTDVTNDYFDHRAMDRAFRAWEGANIFQEQTYKLHNYINESGGEIEFAFDAEEFLNETEGLYIGKNYLEDYYNINNTEDGYELDVLDSR